MGLLDDDVIHRLRIQRMIFHVVGHAEEDLILMDEVDVTGLRDFFLDRVRETNIGNRFEFIGADQGARPSLGEIERKPSDFVPISKRLAESFHNQHRAVAAKRGAFVIAQVSGHSSPTFALIKFDDLRVLNFKQERTKEGGLKAVVSEINNTFLEDRKAMQKSALAVLNDTGGDLAVYDRTNRRNISEYFKAFLGVKRLYTPQDATKRLKKALEDAFTKHQDNAPVDVLRMWRGRLFQATRSREAIEPEEEFDKFGTAVFGDFWQDDAFRKTLDGELHKQKISGEAIEIDKNLIRKPNVSRIRTREDILIRYPSDAENIVSIEKRGDGAATITIKTQGFTRDELVGDEDSKRSK